LRCAMRARREPTPSIDHALGSSVRSASRATMRLTPVAAPDLSRSRGNRGRSSRANSVAHLRHDLRRQLSRGRTRMTFRSPPFMADAAAYRSSPQECQR
jgi:hypothetical protein